MDFDEALKEVLDTAKQPRQAPAGMTPVALSGDDLDTQELKARAWHESLAGLRATPGDQQMTEPHKIWIEQYESAEQIEDEFGTQKALEYLVGEE